jgi:hypothetical protein
MFTKDFTEEFIKEYVKGGVRSGEEIEKQRDGVNRFHEYLAAKGITSLDSLIKKELDAYVEETQAERVFWPYRQFLMAITHVGRLMYKKGFELEDVMRDVLHGDALSNALDFAAFLRTNGISIIPHNYGEGWAIGGEVESSTGYLLLGSEDQLHGPWTFWFNSRDFEDTADETLKETAWANANLCSKCHDGWGECRGGEKVIFGKQYDNLCHSPLMFKDPDTKTLENMKKLLFLAKRL